ncbi:MAG TPA: TraR/DksA family transcriptional regulator [Gemmatales bacterium]|nr:TraR/DksA family transcriptional regulator [Gemmatales bacterium]HMP15679.1 TraR/DksA family transcriptional regulator [Gemmatales bacterium]
MTQKELEQQKHLLQSLASKLGKDLKELEKETRQILNQEGDYGSGQNMNDYLEVSNQAVEEFLAEHLKGNQEFTLSEVEAALDRIKQGTYGLCSECKAEIGIERMKALPYARRCISCASSFHN